MEELIQYVEKQLGDRLIGTQVSEEFLEETKESFSH